MGAICSKIFLWLNGRKAKNINLDQEMLISDKQSSDSNEISTHYQQLDNNDSESIQSVEDLQICASKLVLENKYNPSDVYDLISELGSGAYSKVCKVRHKLTRELRAMKIISKDHSDGVIFTEIEREINILKQLDHPNILKIFEFFQDDFNYYIINEFCEHGDLSNIIDKMKSMNEQAVKVIMYQILLTVSYLHSKSFIHGDLKLENILIQSVNLGHRSSFCTSVNIDVANYTREKETNSEKKVTFALKETGSSNTNLSSRKMLYFKNMSNYEIKIIDFGCSRIFNRKKDKDNKLSGVTGTCIYCSPEVIMDKYNEKCDVWACGVIMYILLCGEPPFNGETVEEVFEKIKIGKFDFDLLEFNNVSIDAKNLIISLLTYDSNDRISAKSAITHSFFGFVNQIEAYKEVDYSVLNNLKGKKSSIKFQQAVTAYLSHNFADKNEVNKLRKLFKFIDINGDGIISKEELLQCYKTQGEEISEDSINEIVKAIDNDGNGYIEYEEFIRALLDKNNLLTETNLKMAFDLFDSDHSGSISWEEIKKIIFVDKSIPESIVSEFLLEINKKESDLISFEEFKNIIKFV